MQFSYDVSHDLRLEVDVIVFNIKDHRILLYDALFEEPLNTLLSCQSYGRATPLGRRCEESEVMRALVFNLREDQLEQLPEGFRLLFSFMRSNVVVTPTESEQQVVCRCDLKILAARPLDIIHLGLAKAWDIDDLLESPSAPVITSLRKAKAFRTVRPHPELCVKARRHIRLKLGDTFSTVCWLYISPFGLDEDVGIRLDMISPLAENNDVDALARGTNLDRKLRLAISRHVLILPDERLLNVLPDILLRGVPDEFPGQEVGHLSFRDRPDGLN